jgi:hypothetical protein
MGILSLFSLNARDFENQTFQFNVGPLFNFARYEFGCLPKIEGYLAGLHFDFQHGAPSSFYFNLQFDGRWNAGFVCGEEDLKSQIKDYRPELQLGYNFFFGKYESVIFTPIVGIGFLYLSNELKPQDITYRYFSVDVPVGAHLQWVVSQEEFEVGLEALYRAQVWARVKVKTPCIELCECDRIKIKRSHGVHIEVPLTWYLTWDLSANIQTKVVPFFDWNRFGCADEANSNGICIDIPQLKQWYLGLHVDLGIRF